MSIVPLHPMIVHFPIVLSVLFPIVAFGSLLILRKRTQQRLVWAIPAGVAIALFASGLAAKQTGSREEDRVEHVVPENVLEQHEHAADRFVALAGVVGLVAILGLAGGLIGSAARAVTAVGSLVVVFAGFQVGKAGGELVYRHNAGAAYASVAPSDPSSRNVSNVRETKKADDD